MSSDGSSGEFLFIGRRLIGLIKNYRNKKPDFFDVDLQRDIIRMWILPGLSAYVFQSCDSNHLVEVSNRPIG